MKMRKTTSEFRHSLSELFLSLVPNQLRDDVAYLRPEPTSDIGSLYRKMSLNKKDNMLHGGFRNFNLFSLLINHTSILDELELNDSLGSAFASCVRDTVSLCPLAGKYFHNNLPMYLLLSFRYPYSTQITFMATHTIPKEHQIEHILSEEGVTYNQFYTDTMRYMELFRVELLGFASSDSLKFTKAVLNTLQMVYRLVLNAEIESINRDALIADRFMYLISSIPETVQYRLLFLSYLSSGKRALSYIDAYTIPRMYLYADTKTYGDLVPFSLWSYICKRHILVDDKTASILTNTDTAPLAFNHFYRIVYQMEQIHLYRDMYPILNALRGFYQEDFLDIIPLPGKDKDILLQYLCMQIPNWMEIWYKMGWSMYPGILRRLYFYYNSDFNRNPDFMFTMKIVLS